MGSVCAVNPAWASQEEFSRRSRGEELSGTEIGRGNLGQEINLCKGPEVERSSCADSWVDYRCH